METIENYCWTPRIARLDKYEGNNSIPSMIGWSKWIPCFAVQCCLKVSKIEGLNHSTSQFGAFSRVILAILRWKTPFKLKIIGGWDLPPLPAPWLQQPYGLYSNGCLVRCLRHKGTGHKGFTLHLILGNMSKMLRKHDSHFNHQCLVRYKSTQKLSTNTLEIVKVNTECSLELR